MSENKGSAIATTQARRKKRGNGKCGEGRMTRWQKRISNLPSSPAKKMRTSIYMLV